LDVTKRRKEPQQVDTIIIGAGFAGLTAARKLLDQGRNQFIVLEARDRVGGRTKHGQIAGIDIDLGGMWMGPTQHQLKALADRYHAQTYPTFLDGKAVYRIAGKEHLGDRENFEGLLNLWDGIVYFRGNRKLNKLLQPLDVKAPWDHPLARQLDGQTVEHWVHANFPSTRLRSVFRLLCLSLFCAEASQVSMLFFLHYVKSGDGLDVLISSDRGGAQNHLFVGGVHQIARKMAAELEHHLQLQEPVVNVSWSSDEVSVTTTNGSYQARTAIVAVPATLLSRITFTPNLPQPKQRLHQRLSMGSAIKYWVAYEKPFWREQGLNGGIYRDDVACSPCFDVTPPDQSIGLIAGFFDANHAINHGDIGMEKRREIVIEMLSEHFGIEARTPVDYVDNDWSAEEWSNGCYGAFAAPGVYADYGRWLRKPIGPLHWAGTETSPFWTGYIDGAIQSGQRAAESVIEHLSTGAIP
jgi:monoamine oxidase